MVFHLRFSQCQLGSVLALLYLWLPRAWMSKPLFTCPCKRAKQVLASQGWPCSFRNWAPGAWAWHWLKVPLGLLEKMLSTWGSAGVSPAELLPVLLLMWLSCLGLIGPCFLKWSSVFGHSAPTEILGSHLLTRMGHSGYRYEISDTFP